MSRADPPGGSDEPIGDEPFGDGFDQADDEDVPEPLARTSLVRALRVSAVDFFYQSIRLVPANVAWGIVLIALGWAAVAFGLYALVVGSPLLGIPLVGIYRLAGLTVRGRDVVLSDALVAVRELFVPALLLATGVAWGLGLLVFNVVLGLNAESPLGWGLATVSGWGVVALLIYSVVAWPVLADPDRTGVPARERARLAGYLVLAAPWRMTALSIIAVALGALSTIVFAALVTITVAYLAVVSCRVVLPDADRLAAVLEVRRAG